MSTLYMDPNGDNSIEWDNSTELTHWEAISQLVRQPVEPNLFNYIDDTPPPTSHSDIFDLTNVAFSGTTSSLAIWVFGECPVQDISVDLYIDGSWQGVGIIIAGGAGRPRWNSVNYPGLWSPEQCNASLMKIISVGGGAVWLATSWAGYVEITFDPAPRSFSWIT